jgi:hypothetical protein
VVFFGFAAGLAMMRQQASPVLWLNLKGEILVAGRTHEVDLTQGVTMRHIANGVSYDFSGSHGGILLGDPVPLQITGSMTVSTWVYLRSYAPNGAQGEILFRGDDRDGLDPYALDVEADGTVNFAICDENGRGAGVKAEINLGHWTHVIASFNSDSGEISMWLNDEKVAFTKTTKRPFSALLSQFAPGVGVGNVQNNHGPHNQPLNGMIADLRLYSAVLTPEDITFDSPKAFK